MSATWTFGDIRFKTRQLTGRFSPNEMSNRDLDKRINQYYQLTFPAEVKLERMSTFYQFVTDANQDTYVFDSAGFTGIVPPATIDNMRIDYYQNPDDFESTNPYQISRANPWTGNGVDSSFQTTLVGHPILPGTTIITDNTEIFQDFNTDWTNDDVPISGSLGGGGTINYKTGAISVSFTSAPDSGQLIYLSYTQFKAGRPISVLFYENEFKFFPPPNTTYRFKIKAWGTPPPLVDAADTPLLNEWGPAISYGTSRQIFADYGELESKQLIEEDYQEQISYVSERTSESLLNTRVRPAF